MFSPRIQDKVSSFSLPNKSKPRHTHTKKISGRFSLPEIEKIEDYLFRHLLYIRYHIPISQYRDVEFVIFFFYSSCNLTSEPAMVSWMMEEGMRLGTDTKGGL